MLMPRMFGRGCGKCSHISLPRSSCCSGHVVVRFKATSTENKQSPAEYCVESVRRSDYEHFLTNLLLPNKIRTPAFTIRALSSEIAGVRDSVSERHLGLMRMQFWRDTIDRMYEDSHAPRHPVALQLHHLVQEHRPTKLLLHNIITSREQFLTDKPFDTLADAEKYGEMAFSSVYLLLLEIYGNTSGHLKHAATALGRLEGLITLLRAAPYNISKRRIYFPTELMVEQEVVTEKILRGETDSESLRVVVEIIAARAQEHLNNCRFRLRHLKKEETLILLPAVSADWYLDKLSKAKCDVFHRSLQVRNGLLPAALYYHKFRGTY